MFSVRRSLNAGHFPFEFLTIMSLFDANYFKLIFQLHGRFIQIVK